MVYWGLETFMKDFYLYYDSWEPIITSNKTEKKTFLLFIPQISLN